MQVFNLPTGYLFVDQYSKGRLETLSIGDYGKNHNVKADFLGYSRPLYGVPNIPCMPMSEKWVITLSTQYGCPMKCKFCVCPQIPFNGNASVDDLMKQLESALRLFPDVKYTERLNIHFARMGEPIFNPSVFSFTKNLSKSYIQDVLGIRTEVIHPVLTTSLPKNFNRLKECILDWCDIKNNIYNGQAGLQFSINSTNEAQREDMFSGMAISLDEFSAIAKDMPRPLGRKYCLNFAYATGYEVDAQRLKDLFDPDMFMVKITPIHNNSVCRENKIETIDGYTSYIPYQQIEEELKAAGFDVLVFVPSMDEEDGLVTCGNAVLSGSVPKEKE